MKHVRPLTFAAFALLMTLALAAPSSRAQDNMGSPKIGIANAARIFNEMQETKDAKQKLENERKQLEATERDKKERIRSLQADRDTLKPDSPQYAERNKELLQAAIEFKSWGELSKMEVERSQKQQMRNLWDKIQQAVAQVAQSKGLDLVVSDQRPEVPDNIEPLSLDQLRMLINQRDILFATKRLDITDDVIAELDKAYKAKSATPAPAATGK